MGTIDLRNCKKGDILISSQGAKLEYVSPTPWRYFTYLDHVVRYVEDKDGKSMGDEHFGTRTHDGFVFAKNRMPETDHDIVKIVFNSIKTMEQLEYLIRTLTYKRSCIQLDIKNNTPSFEDGMYLQGQITGLSIAITEIYKLVEESNDTGTN